MHTTDYGRLTTDYLLYLTISAKLSAFKLAPPTSAPSISFCFIKPAILSGLTEPPYKIRSDSAAPEECLSAKTRRINAGSSCACSGVAVRPVPMAQTGSEEMKIRAGSVGCQPLEP